MRPDMPRRDPPDDFPLKMLLIFTVVVSVLAFLLSAMIVEGMQVVRP